MGKKSNRFPGIIFVYSVRAIGILGTGRGARNGKPAMAHLLIDTIAITLHVHEKDSEPDSNASCSWRILMIIRKGNWV